MVKRFWFKKLSLSLFFVIIFASLFGIPSFAGSSKDRTPPTAPSNLRVRTVNETSVKLIWNASTDNVGAKSYYIYKNNTYIGRSTKTTYTSSGLIAANTYSFTVKAVDTSGNISAASKALSVKTAQPTGSSKIVGYYASWAAKNGFTPDEIDASKLTHINYAFANIGSDLKIAVGNTSVDPANFTKLKSLKKLYPNLKTLISIGGWTRSGKFSDAAYTDASRIAFADSCVEFILQYGFDGVDIDWEYPVGGGLSTNAARPEDKQNFTLLLKTLRQKLDAQGTIDGKHYLLSIAGGTGDSYIENTELGILHQYLDYGNIMTYDFHGSWEKYTDFNAPLYNNSDSPQDKSSVDSSVKAWINAGFPAEKLVVGVPFYGYKYDSVANAKNGLYQRYKSVSSIDYSSIDANYLNASDFVRYYHSESRVPWLFNGSSFISYEDSQSIGLKAKYIKDKGLAGGMIWELSQDRDGVLLNSLFNGLK